MIYSTNTIINKIIDKSIIYITTNKTKVYIYFYISETISYIQFNYLQLAARYILINNLNQVASLEDYQSNNTINTLHLLQKKLPRALSNLNYYCIKI